MKFKIFFEFIFEFFVIFLILFKGCKPLELCRQYSIGNLLYNSFYCLDFCCGNCNFRYCCSNETYLVDQTKCKNNVIQLDLFRTSQIPKTDNSSKISTKATTVQKKNQLFVDTCESVSGSYAAKKCSSNNRYCCGTCQNRYCCDSLKDRLNQFECKVFSNHSNYKNDNQANSNSYLYVILTLILVLLLAFACIPFVIFINKRSKKVNTPNPALPFQSLVPLSILEQLNNTALSAVVEKPKISVTQKEDSPPAYSTIFNKN